MLRGASTRDTGVAAMSKAKPRRRGRRKALRPKHGDLVHEPHAPAHGLESHAHGNIWGMSLGAIGIVFGDIGTSPLYTFKECLLSIREHTGHPATHGEILGVLSMLFWSLTLVVTLKYLAVIMRADHNGEGGIFALLGMVPDRFRPVSPSKFGWVPIAVVIGAALLYGDGVITPAISVLSAVEGLKLSRPELGPHVVQITCVILLGLFAIQSRGTATVGKLFGPVMILWFSALAVLGVINVLHNPHVLHALSPHHAIVYFRHHGLRGTSILASVVLAVTGGEALYADMGHFGRGPIRLAWLGMVWPALVLSYFGQGALVMANPATAESPFFSMVGPALTMPLVILSSFATVIASQALISGAYSLTRQAIQLGFLPRLTVKHTSKDTEGQIYMPQVNWLLAVGCIVIVVSFGSSTRLASAYGLAVTGTMGLTSIVFGVVAITVMKWNRIATLLLVGLFLCFDIPFFITNAQKFSDGGWLPALIGAVLTGMMLLWARGRRIIQQLLFADARVLREALPDLRKACVGTLPGTGVIMAASDKLVPPLITQLVERFKVLHERIVVLHITTEAAAYVHEEHRGEIRPLGNGAFYAQLHFGFMEVQDVPLALGGVLNRSDVDIEEEDVVYFLRRENIVAGDGGQMSAFTERIFAYLHRNATPADRYFHLPPNRVAELGWQLDL